MASRFASAPASRPPHLRRGLVLHGWVQIGGFFIVMGIACMASGGNALFVGIALILMGVGAFGKAKEEADANRPTPSLPAVAPLPLPRDPTEILNVAAPAYSPEFRGQFAVATSTGKFKILPTYQDAAVFADSVGGRTAIARIPTPQQVAISGVQMFEGSAVAAASCINRRPLSTEAQRTAYVLALATGRTLAQTPSEAAETTQAIEKGLEIWIPLYAQAPIELLVAAAEVLGNAIRSAAIVTPEQLAWHLMASAEYHVASNTLRARVRSVRKQFSGD